MVRKWCLGLAICLMVTGCGTKWYHPDKGPAQLAEDEKECRILAENAALANSLTGDKKDLSLFYSALAKCMADRGWSNSPPDQTPPATPQAVDQQASLRLAQYDPNTNQIEFGGKTFPLPEGAVPTGASIGRSGLIYMEVLNFSVTRQEVEYQLELIFQEVVGAGTRFEPIAYPVAEPFFIYDQGREANDRLWRAFAGPIRGRGWLGGVGSYWRLSSNKRLIVTVSNALPDQIASPCPECRLTQHQADQINQLLNVFRPWLAKVGKKKWTKNLNFINIIKQLELGTE